MGSNLKMSKYSEHFFESIITSEGISFESYNETLSIDLGSGLQIANPFNASNVQGVDIISDKKLKGKSLKTFHFRVRTPMKSPKSDLFGSTRLSLPV